MSSRLFDLLTRAHRLLYFIWGYPGLPEKAHVEKLVGGNVVDQTLFFTIEHSALKKN